MRLDPERPRRRLMRLQGWDYASAGAYFVTLVLQERACLLGDVVDGRVELSPAGQTVETWWLALPERLAGVELDAYVVMPNHLHGVVMLSGDGGGRKQQEGGHVGPPLRDETKSASVSALVQWFKTMTTNAYLRGVKEQDWRAFPGRLWQRGYYDHIIRNEDALNGVREYIANNPVAWAEDMENPTQPITALRP